ncbi:S-adenosyl-L-methionine-dependent methyltransferase [Apodospora peruviana]|uniref:S-adenosyl-L-methionine-dependent methyltransferase n=1 Tax=Apodospora peruviana TaxID=516989 RepID=A0AAE0IV31_9PEZI|nr:S-adenosyl-L-methionine-dependent methyltransferase [Apodospora peruviana]
MAGSSPKSIPSPPPAGDDGQPHAHAHADVEADTYSDAGVTTSVTSSVFDYEYDNGRRYHAYRAGQYLLPNDEKEQERLDITHHVFLLSLNGEPCVTKLENPSHILDLGTGTGIWAVDVGDLYPSATVIGTDLSPIQTPWVPPNVQFQVDDATLEWTFPKDHFDFIHARTLAGAIQDWPSLLKSAYDHLKPGGFLEVAEGRADFWCDDDTLTEDLATWTWLTEFRRLSAPLGFDIAPKLPALIESAGFVDVAQTEKVIPLGTWPKDKALKEVGRWFRVQFIEMALEAYSLALFTRMGGWKIEEFQVLVAKVKQELKTNKIHLYTYSSFTTAMKPKTAAASS